MTAGPFEGQVLELDDDHITIGRGEGNVIVAEDESIGEEHCALVREGGGWVIEDLGSGLETLVNGAAVAERRALSNGDTVRIGDIEFVFEEEVPASAPAKASTPAVSADVIATRRYEEGGIDLSNAGSRAAEAGSGLAQNYFKPAESRRADRILTILSLLSIAMGAISIAVLFIRAAAA